jgi:hypothetical protein
MTDERLDTLLRDIDSVCALVDSQGEVGESYMIGSGAATYLGLTTVLLEDVGVLDVRSGTDPVLGGLTRVYSRGHRSEDGVKAEITRQWQSWSNYLPSDDHTVRRIHTHLFNLRRI